MRHSAEKKAETIRINVMLPSDAMGEQRLQLTVASMHGILPLGVSVLFLNGGFIQSKTNHLRTCKLKDRLKLAFDLITKTGRHGYGRLPSRLSYYQGMLIPSLPGLLKSFLVSPLSQIPVQGLDENQDRLRCRGFDPLPCLFISTQKPPEGWQQPTLTFAKAAWTLRVVSGFTTNYIYHSNCTLDRGENLFMARRNQVKPEEIRCRSWRCSGS